VTTATGHAGGTTEVVSPEVHGNNVSMAPPTRTSSSQAGSSTDGSTSTSGGFGTDDSDRQGENFSSSCNDEEDDDSDSVQENETYDEDEDDLHLYMCASLSSRGYPPSNEIQYRHQQTQHLHLHKKIIDQQQRHQQEQQVQDLPTCMSLSLGPAATDRTDSSDKSVNDSGADMDVDSVLYQKRPFRYVIINFRSGRYVTAFLFFRFSFFAANATLVPFIL
jgi:hypothetical protein